MDLRREKRFPVHFNSALTGPKAGDLAGTVLNLSKRGCLIETASQVYAGMPITLRIEVQGDGSPIYIQKAAVRWNRGGKVGVGFLTVALAEQEKLNQLLK